MAKTNDFPLAINADIRDLIFIIRNQKVMIDRDLAKLYGVETKVLNQAVKRNIERFPVDFMFQMNDEEFTNWKSQIVTSNSIKMGLRRKPYVFTELGVAMLSSVLKSPSAIQVNISIMRAFVAMREALSATSQGDGCKNYQLQIEELKQYIEEILADQNDINESTSIKLDLINQAIAELHAVNPPKTARKKIGFVSYD